MIERAESYGLDDGSIFDITEEDNEYGYKPSMALFIDLRPPSQVTKLKEITPPFTNNDSENVIKNLIEYNNYVNETCFINLIIYLMNTHHMICYSDDHNDYSIHHN
jgi:hypothetical protein